ncbi:MAG: cyclic nucleotide-binding domain-containing protein [Desulfobacteraceae bacterium]|nr:cyclic nucleotide-binding domain-containing protein [Desulfobacteraceae bacterium]MBC2757866.1 cyclic nucleotide-binding domain-containing protein [Desulfobacteraceae bacterium]
MMTSHRINIKKDIDHPILKKLPEEVRKEIVQRAEYKTVVAGSMVCRQGDPGDSFFMIKSGTVRIYRKTEENIETELAILGPGGSFGEMALLTGAPRAANVTVVEDAELASLSKEQFDKILKNYPVVALTLIKQMASWLIDNDQIIEREHSRQYKPPRLSVFDFVIIIILSGLCGLIFNQSNPGGIKLFPKINLNVNISTIAPAVAINELKKGTTRFVDTMPSNFYDQEHISGAFNIPMSVFDIMYMMGLSDVDKSQKIIVYGRTVSRLYDVQLANKLYLRGHKNIQVLEGGLPLWKKKGYPIEP